MYEWTESYEDEYLKERIEAVMQAQRDLAAKGQILCSTYEQLWLPALNDLPDTTYNGRECYSAPYGSFEAPAAGAFHGALAFTPKPGMPLPPALTTAASWSTSAATGVNGVGLRENADFQYGLIYFAYGDARSGTAMYLARIKP